MKRSSQASRHPLRNARRSALRRDRLRQRLSGPNRSRGRHSTSLLDSAVACVSTRPLRINTSLASTSNQRPVPDDFSRKVYNERMRPFWNKAMSMPMTTGGDPGGPKCHCKRPTSWFTSAGPAARKTNPGAPLRRLSTLALRASRPTISLASLVSKREPTCGRVPSGHVGLMFQTTSRSGHADRLAPKEPFTIGAGKVRVYVNVDPLDQRPVELEHIAVTTLR